MNLSPQKQEILEIMLLSDKPMTAVELASETKKQAKPTMGYILGLIKAGFVQKAQKGSYQITEAGKGALGIPETTKETAEAILAYAPHDQAFNFYIDVDKPLNLHAHTLRDFANKIDKADLASVEFHVKRGDFETWFKGIGDEELAKKTALLKQKQPLGENLRRQLRELVEQRYLELLEISGQPLPTE